MSCRQSGRALDWNIHRGYTSTTARNEGTNITTTTTTITNTTPKKHTSIRRRHATEGLSTEAVRGMGPHTTRAGVTVIAASNVVLTVLHPCTPRAKCPRRRMIVACVPVCGTALVACVCVGACVRVGACACACLDLSETTFFKYIDWA
eukprot:Opistho-2@76357